MAFRYIENVWAVLRQLADKSVWQVADSGVPTSSTGVGMLGPGSVYTNTATGVRYVNVGTISVPVWLDTNGPVLANGGLGGVGNAKMTYDFAVDGGAVATITPTNSPTIPLGAIILGGVIDTTVAPTSGGAATIALGLGSGAQVASLKVATGFATYAANLTVPLTELFTAATYLKVAAATRMTITIAAATLTAGKISVNIVYVQGNV